MRQLVIEDCVLFSFIRFLSHRVFPNKVLTRHIIYQWASKGECYEYLIKWMFIMIKVKFWYTLNSNSY